MHDDVDVLAEDVEAEPETGLAHCRHCGQPNDDAPTEGDWQCPSCERYQETVQCPTCKHPVNVNVLPADAVPAPHAPARRRKV